MAKRIIHLLSAILLSALLVGCGPRGDEVKVGELRRVSQVPYVFELHIAVDPNNPDHLAAVVIEVAYFECAFSECRFSPGRYTSSETT